MFCCGRLTLWSKSPPVKWFITFVIISLTQNQNPPLKKPRFIAVKHLDLWLMRDTCAFWHEYECLHPPSKSDWSKRSAIGDRVHHLTTGRNWIPLDRQVRWTFTKVLSAPPIFRYCKITAGAFQNHVFIVQRGARSKAFSLRVLGQPRTLQDLHQGENKKTRLSTPGTAAPITTEIWKKDKNPPNLPPVHSARSGVEMIYDCFDR